MKIDYVVKNCELTDRIKSHAEKKLRKVAKFLEEPVDVRVTLAQEKNRNGAEVHVAHRFGVVQAKEETDDLLDAINASVDKVEKQVRRARKKFIDKRRRASRQPGQRPAEVVGRKSVGQGSSMKLSELARPELIFPSISGSDGSAILHALAERVAGAGFVVDAEELYRELQEREALGSTGIGRGVAVPHCKLSRISDVILAVGVSDQNIDFSAVDEEPVRIFFVLISPKNQPTTHLKSLAAISKWIKANGYRQGILETDSPQEIYALLTGDAPVAEEAL